MPGFGRESPLDGLGELQRFEIRAAVAEGRVLDNADPELVAAHVTHELGTTNRLVWKLILPGCLALAVIGAAIEIALGRDPALSLIFAGLSALWCLYLWWTLSRGPRRLRRLDEPSGRRVATEARRQPMLPIPGALMASFLFCYFTGLALSPFVTIPGWVAWLVFVALAGAILLVEHRRHPR